MKIIFLIFSSLLFIYMMWPAPSSITQFKALPNSDKSDLAGDTWQIPNVSAYFSNNYRDFVIPFYLENYWHDTSLPFPPLRINYPPEFSWTVIKKHTDSTYLEELTYPLRDSLYVNGFEPFNPDGSKKYYSAIRFDVGKNQWDTKVTLRYYKSSLIVRFIVWFGICSSIVLLYRLGRRIKS